MTFVVAFAALSASPSGAQASDPLPDPEPIECEVGFFSVDGNAPCSPAPAGTFVATTGATEATPCSLGTYQPNLGTISCDPAEPGTFVATIGATGATPCETGRFQPLAGQSECLLAPAGTFVATIGATAASPCPSGTSSQAGSDSADDCIAVILDSDGDGVLDDLDRCAGTDLSARDTPRRWQRFRLWTDTNGDFVYRNGQPSGITVADTFGCSAAQIVHDLEDGRLLERVAAKLSNRLGFSSFTLRSWIRSN